jgi:hypothetical protein
LERRAKKMVMGLSDDLGVQPAIEIQRCSSWEIRGENRGRELVSDSHGEPDEETAAGCATRRRPSARRLEIGITQAPLDWKIEASGVPLPGRALLTVPIELRA